MKVTNVDVNRIKALAKKQGIQMKYFCDYFGKAQSYFADIRNGKNRLDENELQFIADKLNTTVEYLTGQTDDPTRPEEKKEPGAITDAEQAELDAMFLSLSPEQQDMVLDILRGLVAQKEEREKRKTDGRDEPSSK